MSDQGDDSFGYEYDDDGYGGGEDEEEIEIENTYFEADGFSERILHFNIDRQKEFSA